MSEVDGVVEMTLLANRETRLTIDEGHVSAARSVVGNGAVSLVLRWPNGGEQQLAENLQQLLMEAVRAMADGNSVSIAALPQELTTTIAADVLGVSRPTLMKWVSEEKVPSHKVGSHTRFWREDVLKLRRKRDEERRAALRELMELGAHLDD